MKPSWLQVFFINVVNDDTIGVGSIAAGGRYDGLVGMFSGGQEIPCVGISIGVERVFSIISRKYKLSDIKPTQTQVYVATVDGMLKERMALCRELWDANIKAEFMFKQSPKLLKQLSQCEKQKIPFAVIFGSTELQQGVVNIKDFEHKKEETVKRQDLIPRLKELLSTSDTWSF